MNIGSALALGISVGGFVITVVTLIARLSKHYGKLEEQVKFNEERDKEERQKSSVKFAELYNRMATSEGDVKELNAKVDTLQNTCVRIECKLDKLIERGL